MASTQSRPGPGDWEGHGLLRAILAGFNAVPAWAGRLGRTTTRTTTMQHKALQRSPGLGREIGDIASVPRIAAVTLQRSPGLGREIGENLGRATPKETPASTQSRPGPGDWGVSARGKGRARSASTQSRPGPGDWAARESSWIAAEWASTQSRPGPGDWDLARQGIGRHKRASTQSRPGPGDWAITNSV